LNSQLGQRLEIFGPWRANVYAGYAIAGIFALLGTAMLVWGLSQILTLRHAASPTARKEAKGDLILGLIVGLLLFLVSVVFGYLARIMSGNRLDIHEYGFRIWFHGGGGDSVFWQDVTRIEERLVPDAAPDLGVISLLIPTTAVRRIAIVRSDGRPFEFDRETVHRLGRLIKRLRVLAGQRAIEWKVVRQEE
jgi:hypothetical protein